MTKRTERYNTYVLEEWFKQPVHIIGVGAIGRQVALQCAAMGFRKMYLYDYDTVEEVNMGTQGYRPDQIGIMKVEATGVDATRIAPEMKVQVCTDSFESLLENDGSKSVIFSCVDSMEARRKIAEYLYRGVVPSFWLIDGRMRRTSIRLVSACDETIQQYIQALYSDGETEPGRCTAQTTIYMASVAAGLMVNRWVQYQRGMDAGFMDEMFDPTICMHNLVQKEEIVKQVA